MNFDNLLRVAVMALLLAAGTWLVGWWAVPLIALIVGAMMIMRPAVVGLSAGVAWAALMYLDFKAPAFGALVSKLGSVMGMSAVTLVGLTILLPMILGWSAASTGHALRTLRNASGSADHMK